MANAAGGPLDEAVLSRLKGMREDIPELLRRLSEGRSRITAQEKSGTLCPEKQLTSNENEIRRLVSLLARADAAPAEEEILQKIALLKERNTVLSEECRKSELCDENGFLKGTFHIPFKARLYLDKKTRYAIYCEVEAQIKKFLQMGFTLMHADSHNYTHSYFSVYSEVSKLLKKYGFTSVRISRNVSEGEFSLPFKIYKTL